MSLPQWIPSLQLERFFLDDVDEELAMKKIQAKQKQQSGNRERSELLGSDHKQARAEIRSSLREGYYVSHSGKKAIRVLHFLGRSYVVPGVDYLSFTFGGTTIPDSSAYDTVCKWCAKSVELKDVPGSSGTNTSSSRSAVPRVWLRSDAKSPAETLEFLSAAPLCSEFIRTPEPQGPAETLKKTDVSALHP